MKKQGFNSKEQSSVRLNKYLSNAGICSRREADKHITEGHVKVNGNVVTNLGEKIPQHAKVEFKGQVVQGQKNKYILLNKPKDVVTTMDDPGSRHTVHDIIKHAVSERVYPVGRLDRNTTGLLLLTNDGDLTQRLLHPKYNKKKIYHVGLDKPVDPKDMGIINKGIELEDGFIKADKLAYVHDNKTEVGIEIHSGKNRIVRRIFEYLGYKVKKLDRVYFAGLTKKNLPRGKYRELKPNEINMLKSGKFK
ncbi:MAG: pseudouridine synthase [Bacteroidota bacterium]|nr:pseudouridine synthase [Bacteroidota bacterium]